jgi:ketosteroid isomerase-like protein
MDEVRLRDDFDKMAVVVDWLDCCRNRHLDALLDLYAGDASLECACENARYTGRSQLAAYWQPKLSTQTPDAFRLEEITPGDDGVTLVYLSFEGKSVRMTFAFDANGKIAHTRCRPAPALPRQLSA